MLQVFQWHRSSAIMILSIKWNLVVRGSWFVVVVFYVPTTVLTVVQICCTCADVQ